MKSDDFIQAIIENPDDPVLRFAYADWLEDHDRAGLAEFIRVQCHRATLPADHPQQPTLKTRERDLLAEPADMLVQPWLKEFVSASTPDPGGLRPIVERLAVLPLFFNWDDFYAIRLDGQVMVVGWGPPYEMRLADARETNLALFQGTSKYPALCLLIPPRPLGSSHCSYCNGRGNFSHFSLPLKEMVCYCGGLGWLPP